MEKSKKKVAATSREKKPIAALSKDFRKILKTTPRELRVVLAHDPVFERALRDLVRNRSKELISTQRREKKKGGKVAGKEFAKKTGRNLFDEAAITSKPKRKPVPPRSIGIDD